MIDEYKIREAFDAMTAEERAALPRIENNNGRDYASCPNCRHYHAMMPAMSYKTGQTFNYCRDCGTIGIVTGAEHVFDLCPKCGLELLNDGKCVSHDCNRVEDQLAEGAATVASQQADEELSQVVATVEDIAEYLRQTDCTEFDAGIVQALDNLAALRSKISAWWTYKSEQSANANQPLVAHRHPQAAPFPKPFEAPEPKGSTKEALEAERYNIPDYETLRGIVFSHIAGNQTTEELNEELGIYICDGDEPVITDDTDWGRDCYDTDNIVCGVHELTEALTRRGQVKEFFQAFTPGAHEFCWQYPCCGHVSAWGQFNAYGDKCPRCGKEAKAVKRPNPTGNGKPLKFAVVTKHGGSFLGRDLTRAEADRLCLQAARQHRDCYVITDKEVN